MCSAVFSPSSSPRRAGTSSPDLWLCLRFAGLALDALQEGDRPLDFAHQYHRLVAVGSRAAARGLYPGMSVSQALVTAPDCRGAEREPAREQQHLQRLACWACRYTPQVSLGPQSVLLEVGHSLRLFGGFRRLFRQIEQDLHRFRLSARPGVAHTPAAAQVLSHARNNGVRAARHNAADREAFLLLLGQMGIEYLDVDDAIIRQLQSCGFDVLEALLAVPRAEIGRRFGQSFMAYLARLLGEKEDPRVTVVPPEPFLSVQDFAEPVHNAQWIAQCTDAMLRQFCEFLRRRQWRCLLLEWRFYNDKKLIEQLPIPLSSRHYGFHTFKQLTDLRLEKLRLSGELMRIELFSDRLLPAQLWIDDFFDPRIKEQEVSELVDKLAARLGHDAVCQLVCVAEPVPELSVRRVPFADPEATGQSRTAGQYTPADNLTTCEFQPLWLLPAPQPLAREDRERSRPLDDRGRPLSLIQGPDRIDSHWWRDGSASNPMPDGRGGKRRDYYIARQRDGRLLWIFYDRPLEQWFLQGLFG